ncbi:cation/H(+) antiporter 3-like [Corylus avellana]|uniref:cation/H(+) antiporter 3-like n=1 Tax=Corylus avellana TaxID=13451 RepID=UPI00286C113A|nr:cation/H(+) antiporter 3-like [Corylus avellana]
MVSNLLGLFLSLMATFTKTGTEQGSKIVSIDLAAFVSYVIVLVFAIRPLMFWVIRQTPEGRPVKDTYIHTIMLILLGFTLFSHFFGQTVLLGPFLLGLAIPDGLPLGSAIVSKLNCFVSDVFLPVYVTTCTMRIITDEVFSMICVYILLTAIFMPLLLKFLYDPSRQYAGYQKRDLMNCTRNAELRILACIHRPDNIVAVTTLLEVSCPSRERPLIVSNNLGAVSVNVFTVISPLKSMHENICILGLDKLTSLIVMPFHRKWSIDGSIESEDNAMRTLNCNVLELAPCSVGILIDRGNLGHSLLSSKSSYSVAMIFFGGNDDREALTFAKRMVNHSKTTLTVVHFVTVGNEDDTYWDEYFFDSEILKDVKLNSKGYESVLYQEKMVKDGAQTALVIRYMVKEYDLIIVGRRHGVETPQISGLAEWSEFSELGIIGDFLASLDLNSRTSVFVVQQQKNK